MLEFLSNYSLRFAKCASFTFLLVSLQGFAVGDEVNEIKEGVKKH